MKKNDLKNVLKRAYQAHFNGEILVLEEQNAQLIGKIDIERDLKLRCDYYGHEGVTGLYQLMADQLDLKKVKLVESPGILSGKKSKGREIEGSINQVLINLDRFAQGYKKLSPYRPSKHLIIKKSKTSAINYQKLKLSERILIKMLINKCKVVDIYRNGQLPAFEVTLALVSLRKRGLIQVFGKESTGEVTKT